MVSKIVKKAPVKSIKDRRNRHNRQRGHRKKSPAKPVSLIDSIKRRLAKFFSKLARISTPIGCATASTNGCSNKKKRYKVFNKTHPLDKEAEPLIDCRNDSVCRLLFSDFEKESINNQLHQKKHILPPLISPKKRTVFLDLDETLVHSNTEPPKRFDFFVRPNIDGELMTFYVLKRPGVDEFLEELSARYEVVVFTAGLREYASLVLDRIDKKGLISHRLYRDSCSQVDGRYVKDLSETGRDLDKVVIVDDNPNSYFLQPKNAVPIKPFTSDMTDTELWGLIKFFEACDSFDDMRDAAKHFVSNGGDKHIDDHFELE